MKCQQILWQFTLCCNKNCKYCGSKDVINVKKQSNIDRINIAKQIANLKPNEITITGGQPSMYINELLSCINILKNADISVKLLTNGNLFSDNFKEQYNQIIEKLDVVGVSINEESDIEYIKHFFDRINFKKTTMITNFGSHNIKLFEQLSKFSVNFATWQIQLTMGNQLQLDLKEIFSLKEKIKKFKQKKMVGVLQADNIVCGKCHAGTRGCSITYNGDVIPCLSYRSWKNDLNVQGNVFERSLEEIWNEEFKFFRSRQFFPCCKSITGVDKLYSYQEQFVINDGIAFVYGINKIIDKKKSKQISVYGVNIDNTPMVYGVGTIDFQ